MRAQARVPRGVPHAASPGTTSRRPAFASPTPTSRPSKLLVEELAHPDEERVLYAIDLLESLEKRHLVTPLLLYHAFTARPRANAAVSRCAVVGGRGAAGCRPWSGCSPTRMPKCAPKPCARFRQSAGRRPPSLLRRHLTDGDPRMVATAAVALAAGSDPKDLGAATAALQALASDARETAVPARVEVARALGNVPGPIAAIC